MARYEIKNFNGGFSDYEDRGTLGAWKFASNNDPYKDVDSFSANQALIDEGISQVGRSPSLSVSPSSSPSSSPSLSPSVSASPSTGVSSSVSPTPSVSVSRSPSTTPSMSLSPSPSSSGGISSVFYDLIKVFVKGSDGFTYGFGNTGYIYRRDEDGFWIRLYKDPDGEISGAAEWYAANGKVFLFWATDKKLHRKELPGNNSWNDVDEAGTGQGDTWPKTNLTSGVPHTMAVSGGSLLICNGSSLALVGYDRSYTNDAVNLIPGNIAKTLVERNGRAIIGTYRKSSPEKGINAAIDTEVQLAQVGTNGELFFANMADSTPIKRFPGGGKVNPYGVCNEVEQVNFFEWEQNALSWIDKQAVGNMALWAVYDADTGKGGIYSYGRKNKNKPIILNLNQQFDADELGAITHTAEGVTLVSYRDGSDFGVKAVDPDNKATATYEGIDFLAPPNDNLKVTVWKTATIKMKQLPANCSVEFWYRIDKTGNFVRALTANGATSWSEPNTKRAVFRIVAEGEIFEPRIVIHPYQNETPEIYRLRTYF